MKRYHHIQKIAFLGDTMILTVDSKEHRIDLNQVSRKLLAATTAQRNGFEYDSFGYGIHWPALEEDLSVDALIGVSHKYVCPETLISSP